MAITRMADCQRCGFDGHAYMPGLECKFAGDRRNPLVSCDRLITIWNWDFRGGDIRVPYQWVVRLDPARGNEIIRIFLERFPPERHGQKTQ